MVAAHASVGVLVCAAGEAARTDSFVAAVAVVTSVAAISAAEAQQNDDDEEDMMTRKGFVQTQAFCVPCLRAVELVRTQ